MRVIVTGARGFVADGLIEALNSQADALGRSITDLILADLEPGQTPGRWVCGDLSDPAYLERLTGDPVDVFYHLASVPGSLAETRPDLGDPVNLMAPIGLAARLAAQSAGGGPVARFVLASTIAVLGSLGPEPVREDHLPHPDLTYGAHKWIAEILLADYARRGQINAISLRLPGIVARPPSESGHGSAFMSQLFHKAAAAETFVCPVSQDATAWWMSRQVVVANLLHAATVPADMLPPSRVIQLPVLHASIDAIVAALADRFGAPSVKGFTFAPNERIEALFGRLPPLVSEHALSAGFIADGDAKDLVRNVMSARSETSA